MGFISAQVRLVSLKLWNCRRLLQIIIVHSLIISPGCGQLNGVRPNHFMPKTFYHSDILENSFFDSRKLNTMNMTDSSHGTTKREQNAYQSPSHDKIFWQKTGSVNYNDALFRNKQPSDGMTTRKTKSSNNNGNKDPIPGASSYTSHQFVDPNTGLPYPFLNLGGTNGQFDPGETLLDPDTDMTMKFLPLQMEEHDVFYPKPIGPVPVVPTSPSASTGQIVPVMSMANALNPYQAPVQNTVTPPQLLYDPQVLKHLPHHLQYPNPNLLNNQNVKATTANSYGKDQAAYNNQGLSSSPTTTKYSPKPQSLTDSSFPIPQTVKLSTSSSVVSRTHYSKGYSPINPKYPDFTASHKKNVDFKPSPRDTFLGSGDSVKQILSQCIQTCIDNHL